MNRRRLSVAVLVLAALIAAGCGPPRHNTAPIPPITTTPTSSKSSHRTIELSCADSTSGALAPNRPANRTVDGLTLEDVGATAGKLRGLVPADVGLHVPDAQALYFAKTPAYLRPGTPAISIELPAGSNGYLAWVPAGIWTQGGVQPIDLAPWMASRIVFDGCRHQASTYLGGVLSTQPSICLTLRVTPAGRQQHEVHLGD